jgi:hypothetical protein
MLKDQIATDNVMHFCGNLNQVTDLLAPWSFKRTIARDKIFQDIQKDIFRTDFFGLAGEDYKYFVYQWLKHQQDYIQGDMVGGHFGMVLLASILNKLNNPQFDQPKGGRLSIRFGYIDDRKEVCGFSIDYTTCFEKNAWAISIMKNPTAEPDKVKVHILTSLDTDSFPGFTRYTFRQHSMRESLTQFFGAKNRTAFLKNLFTNSNNFSINDFLSQLHGSKDLTILLKDLFLDNNEINLNFKAAFNPWQYNTVESDELKIMLADYNKDEDGFYKEYEISREIQDKEKTEYKEDDESPSVILVKSEEQRAAREFYTFVHGGPYRFIEDTQAKLWQEYFPDYYYRLVENNFFKKLAAELKDYESASSASNVPNL